MKNFKNIAALTLTLVIQHPIAFAGDTSADLKATTRLIYAKAQPGAVPTSITDTEANISAPWKRTYIAKSDDFTKPVEVASLTSTASLKRTVAPKVQSKEQPEAPDELIGFPSSEMAYGPELPPNWIFDPVKRLKMSLASKAKHPQEYKKITLTGYSAGCKKYDGRDGGKDESALGGRNLRPRSNTLDGPSVVIMAAIPQKGGDSSLYGCLVDLDFSESNVPRRIQARFSKKIIAAADYYGKKSNVHIKMDISHECTRDVKHFLYYGVKARTLQCYSADGLQAEVANLKASLPPVSQPQPTERTARASR